MFEFQHQEGKSCTVHEILYIIKLWYTNKEQSYATVYEVWDHSDYTDHICERGIFLWKCLSSPFRRVNTKQTNSSASAIELHLACSDPSIRLSLICVSSIKAYIHKTCGSGIKYRLFVISLLLLINLPRLPGVDLRCMNSFPAELILGWQIFFFIYIEGILPKGPYLPCVSMAGRALLAGYHRYVNGFMQKLRNSIANTLELRLFCTEHIKYIVHD